MGNMTDTQRPAPAIEQPAQRVVFQVNRSTHVALTTGDRIQVFDGLGGSVMLTIGEIVPAPSDAPARLALWQLVPHYTENTSRADER
jgi:hypothetical protein